MTDNGVYIFIYGVCFTLSLFMTISFYKDKEYKEAIGCTILTLFNLFGLVANQLLLMEVFKWHNS